MVAPAPVGPENSIPSEAHALAIGAADAVARRFDLKPEVERRLVWIIGAGMVYVAIQKAIGELDPLEGRRVGDAILTAHAHMFGQAGIAVVNNCTAFVESHAQAGNLTSRTHLQAVLGLWGTQHVRDSGSIPASDTDLMAAIGEFILSGSALWT